MKVTLAMITREYVVRVRKRSFIIGTILGPVFLLVSMSVPALLMTTGGGEREVVVLDQSGDPALVDAIRNSIKGNHGGTTFNLSRREIPQDADIDNAKSELKPEVEKDTSKAYLVLRKGVLEGQAPEYYASNTTDVSIVSLGEAVKTAITQRRLVRAGIDPGRVAEYTAQAEWKTIKVRAGGESEENGMAFIGGIVIVLGIYFSVFGHSAAVLNGMVEEKMSRIVEVLITSVEPYQIMTGKLIGIGLVGLTQFGIWGVCALLVGAIGKGAFPSLGFDPSRIASVVAYCVIYYVLGYFLFASLYLIPGAVATTAEEAGQLARPLVFLTTLPVLIVWAVLKSPDNTLSVVLSMIPLFTSTVMVMRIAVGSPPLWQILASMLVMMVSMAATLCVAARIYRAGILMYGKRMTLAEVGHWLRYSRT